MPVYGPTNIFSTQSGNVPVSQLDQDFTDAFAGINNAFLVGTLAARPAPDVIGKGRYYFAVDDNGGTLYRDNGAAWVAVAPSVNQGTGQTSYTKGDLLVALSSTALGKLGVGQDGQVLTADSAQATGLKYASPVL